MRPFFWLFFVLGLLGIAVCFYGATLDWRELQRADAYFVSLKRADLATLFVADARQNIHRINLFADVVWALLGAILAAIGLHGLCANVQRK